MFSPPTLISAIDYDKEHFAKFVERLNIKKTPNKVPHEKIIDL